MLWCLAVLYLLDIGAFLFCWRYRGTLEEDGIGLWGMQLGMLLRFCGVDGERDATFLWLTLPTDRKKHAGDGSGLGVLS